MADSRTTTFQKGTVGRRGLLAALSTAAAVGVGLIGLSSKSVLIVEDATTGEQYLADPVENGSTVGLEYMHSVEKSRVYDEYRVEDQTLVNTRMEFESYGWGLPSGVDVRKVDGIFIYEPDTPITELDRLSVSPGEIAGHTLIIDGNRYDLVALSDSRDVRIYVDRRPLIQRVP